ncbi:MAG: carbohydrate ABC transporter permease [Caldilineaceae bacterium]|nr:carbohydrate ABC transporter permease [Caldilineaceae bacterium]
MSSQESFALPSRDGRSAQHYRIQRRFGTTIQYLLLGLLLFFAFFIILVMISMSLRPTVLIYADFWALPWPPVMSNYQTAVFDLIPSMGRTLFISVVSILGVLVVACPSAYAFARMRFPGSGVLFYVVLAVMMIPGIILLTPHFILAQQLQLRGSLYGLILFYIAGGQPFAIFLLSTFFRSQSEEIFEAARIDGASELHSLIRIAVPLAWPILMTVAILNFLGIYDDFIWPRLMLPQHLETLVLALERYNPQIGEYSNRPELGPQAAGYVFASLPQLFIFVFAMKYFIQGLTSGAVKA